MQETDDFLLDQRLGSEPESIRAITIDTAPRAKIELPQADEPEPRSAELYPARPRLRLLVGATMAGCIAILTLAIVRTHEIKDHRPAIASRALGAAAAHAVTPTDLPDAPATPPTAPVAAPTPGAPAAAPTTATISLAPTVQKGRSLVVDGKASKATSVVVACGPHLVAVGKEKPHSIQAGCGDTVVVESEKTKHADGAHTPPPKKGAHGHRS